MRRWHAELASWPGPALYGAFLAWFGGWTVLVVVVADLAIEQEDTSELVTAASGLMPAVGVLFSFLTGFVISNQWTRARGAAATVGTEADACLRLALASQSNGTDGVAIRSDLERYITCVVEREWPVMNVSATRHHGEATTAEAMRTIGRVARTEATRSGVSDPISWDLLGAAESVAVSRRDRLNLAGNGLPTALFMLVFLSGVALSLNAAALGVGLDRWAGVLIAILVVLIALDLALIVAISGPFVGHLRIHPIPLVAVLEELRDGDFGELAHGESTIQPASADPADVQRPVN